MSNCNHHHSSCGSCQNGCDNCGNWNNWDGWNGCFPRGDWGFGSCCRCNRNSNCPHWRWRHPIHCNPAYFSWAGTENGPTLVIHKIVLEAGCEQSCTPRSFHIRVTGPSYPCGEIFTLRAGSCLTLDEPLVISGLEPGTYQIEMLYDCPQEYVSTITGAECGGCVSVTNSAAPTVVTIVSRRRVCRRRQNCGCSW